MTDHARLAIRVALTAVMAWLATVLLLPGETFAGSRSFRVMQSLAPENEWALVFSVLACIGSLGIAVRSPLLRMVCGSFVATMHGVVGLCLVLANPISTGAGTYGILALLGYYLVWEHAREGL